MRSIDMNPEKPEEQFLKVYEKYADAIFRHCYFRISDKHTAQDLTQAAFERTWKYIAEGNEIDNIKAFLYRVANNLLVDTYRKRDTNKTSSLEYLEEEKGWQKQSTENTEENVAKKINTEGVLKYIERLTPEYRQVIVMKYIDDMKVKEIATTLNESQNSTSVRLHRAINKLKKEIENYEK